MSIRERIEAERFFGLHKGDIGRRVKVLVSDDRPQPSGVVYDIVASPEQPGGATYFVNMDIGGSFEGPGMMLLFIDAPAEPKPAEGPRFKVGDRVRMNPERGWKPAEVVVKGVEPDLGSDDGPFYTVQFDDGASCSVYASALLPLDTQADLEPPGCCQTGDNDDWPDPSFAVGQYVRTSTMKDGCIGRIADLSRQVVLGERQVRYTLDRLDSEGNWKRGVDAFWSDDELKPAEPAPVLNADFSGCCQTGDTPTDAVGAYLDALVSDMYRRADRLAEAMDTPPTDARPVIREARNTVEFLRHHAYKLDSRGMDGLKYRWLSAFETEEGPKCCQSGDTPPPASVKLTRHPDRPGDWVAHFGDRSSIAGNSQTDALGRLVQWNPQYFGVTITTEDAR